MHSSTLSHAADLGDVCMERRHSLEGGARKAVSLEVVEVCDLVDEDVGV